GSAQTVVVGAEPESEIRGSGVVAEKLTANFPVWNVGCECRGDAIRAGGHPVPDFRIELAVFLTDVGTEERFGLIVASLVSIVVPGKPVVFAAVHAGGRIACRDSNQFMVGKAQSRQFAFALFFDRRELQRQLLRKYLEAKSESQVDRHNGD